MSKNTHTLLCLRLSVKWLFTIKIPWVQIKRYTSLMPRRIQVYWIYCFWKHCSRKHKLQETFTVSYASWRRHSTFDPWTVKTTAGIYKGGEKGASLPPAGNWQMEDVYSSNIPNSSACYFYYIPSTTTWFNANANNSCISVRSEAEIQPATNKHTNVFPQISVPPHSTPTLGYSQHIICFCAIFSIITTAHLRALQGFALLTKAVKLYSGNLEVTGAELRGN